MTLHILNTPKKSARSQGPAVVGIQLKSTDDFDPLLYRI